MFVDTSAIIAILTGESEAEHFSNVIAASTVRYTSSFSLRQRCVSPQFSNWSLI